MNRTWTFTLCVPLASAALLAGCTQEVDDSQRKNRTPYDNAASQPRQQNPEVSLTGCVSTGQGNNQFMLYDVRSAPAATQPAGAPASGSTHVPENVPIRLAMNDGSGIEKLLGQSVQVTGVLSDGRDTIGTTGPPKAPDEPGSRVDQSQAASRQSPSEKVREEAGPIGNRAMNNGTFPELKVSRVQGTGQKCVANRMEDRR